MPTGETDTPAAVHALLRRRLMERSGVERLQMACDKFDAAIALIVASLPAEVVADPAACRVAVLQRMYWPERNEPLVRETIAALTAQSGDATGESPGA